MILNARMKNELKIFKNFGPHLAKKRDFHISISFSSEYLLQFLVIFSHEYITRVELQTFLVILLGFFMLV